jgi:hypothetical protein
VGCHRIPACVDDRDAAVREGRGSVSDSVFRLTWLLREVPLRTTAPAEGIGESFASRREDRADRALERIISSIASGRMRTGIYRRIVDESGVELTPAEAWVLGRLATIGTLEHARSRVTTPEEVAELTGGLLHRGYLTIEPAEGTLELGERGREAHATLVEVGRATLSRQAVPVRRFEPVVRGRASGRVTSQRYDRSSWAMVAGAARRVVAATRRTALARRRPGGRPRR